MVVLLAFTVAVPQGLPKNGGFPLSWLRALLAVPAAWASPMPPTPKQASGTAKGRGHDAAASATRAGGGAGRPTGRGKGELPAYVPAARRFTPGQSAAGRRGFDPKTSQRVAAKSTATSTYFTNADGSITRKFSQTPVNYRDSAGNWQAIDTALRRAGDGRWSAKANSLNVGFAATADDPHLVSIALDASHSIAYGLGGAAPVSGVANGSTVTYPAALPGTDVRLTSTLSGMREDLVLHSADAGNAWQFPLDLHGLTATVAKDGSVELRDAAGKKVGAIPASYAYDAKVDPKSGERATTHAARYELRTVAGSTVLTLTVDTAWLGDPARVFPVTVDPSILNTQAITTYAASGTTNDHSMEDFIKIGSFDSGTNSARSFLRFPTYGIDNSQISVSAASLDLFVNHANGCPTAQRFDVAAVTQDWTPSTLTYPGPSVGASIGNLTPSTPNACANTAVDPLVGDWVTVPLSTATFTGWGNGTVKDYGLAIYAATTDSLHWKYLGSTYSKAPNLTLTYTGNVAPQIIAQQPNNGAGLATLTPQLSAQGTIDLNVVGPSPDGGPQYEYQIYDSGGTRVLDSGLVNGAYTVPAGKLQWGKTYVWEVQAFDGANFTLSPVWYQFTTQVPQPAITSGLSQNSGGHGFDPAIGNYTTSSTDADTATVGPALSVVRDYNSRDPRATGAFGAAWSSLYDAQAVERYTPSNAVSTVVATYPDGSQVGYGRNADGTFTPPLGRAAKMIKLSNGYELIDKADTTYRFTQSLTPGAYGISSVADANGRTETFTWSGGHITTVTSVVSGRALHLNWTTPSGATAAHVSTVVTDPVVAGQSGTALTWTYGYTGDQLTSVCPPGTTTACTRYGYQTGSPYHSQVLDQAPKSFWPLAETSGSTAASAVAASEGADAGTYSNVTLANTAGPLTGGSAMAGAFNGTSSKVQLPNLHVGQALSQSVSIWFKTAAGAGAGVLFSSSDMTIRSTATSGNYLPTLYVGSKGFLYGMWWLTDPGLPTPIKSSKVVNDGLWHHVVLTGSETSQVMYLDGAQVAGSTGGWGTLGNEGASMPWLLSHNYLGTGFLGGLPWPDNPYTNDASTLHAVYLNGSVADVSYYDTQLGLPDVTALYQTATHSTSLLTSITRPSGNAYATVGYDPVSATVTTVTDENGGKWTVAAPTVSGSSQVYRASVLGSGPQAYYRLGESAGAAQAISEVKYAAGTYANTTLGGAGRFADQPAAAFNGTTSSVQMPGGLVNGTGAQSFSMWFNTTTTGGVLLSTQASALGGTTCPCLPVLWVTSDGKLRGLAPSIAPTGPLTGGIPGKCVDDYGSQTADATIIQMWTCNGTDAQNWTINADGSVRVFGKCLDVKSSGTVDGTKVQLYTCNSSGAQMWQPFNGGLRNPQSGKCLDDPNSSTADGTQLQIYTCNGSKAQQWTLSLASSAAVTDGRWHQAVLTSSGTAQTLYVDGVKTQSSSGAVTLNGGPQPNTYLGAGATGAGWASLTANTTAYFKGGLAEAAFFRSELSGAAVTAQYDAARNSSGLAPMTTVKVTDPGSKTLTYQYDPLHNNRMIAMTDGRGFRTTYGYDTSGFLYTSTDPNGAVTTTGHDAEGNEVSKTTCQNQAANVCSTTYMTYQPNTMGVDQAKGATVTASSSYVGDGWSTANAVDGNTTSVTGAPGWSSVGSSSASTTQWVQVDMGSARSLNRVDLYPRTSRLGAGFPQAFTIAVSADGSTWTTVTTQTNYAQPTTPAPASFSFTARSVRYVKVNATTLRTDGSSTYYLQLSEIAALNDLPDPTAGLLLTQRDPRSSSATDNTYLTSYGYDAVGDATSVTGPPVAGFPNGRTSTVAYTDGTSVPAADTGSAPAGLPYRTVSAGGAVYTISYLHNGDVASTTDADGLVTRYAYDNIGQVASKTVDSGKPAGWWRLNQTSGTVVSDSSGLANAGSATNVTWSGGAAVFNGDGKVTVGAPVVNTAASYTLSAWVNLSSMPAFVTPVVSVWGNAYPSAEISYSNGSPGSWKFQTSDRDVGSPANTIVFGSTPPATGSWTHLAGVYNAASATMTLYVNGAAQGTATTTRTWTAKSMVIGSFVFGSVANVQVYQRALSATDVATLYGAGNAGGTVSDTTPSGLVTSYGYDGESRVTSEVDPAVTDRITGAVHTAHVSTVYDVDGNLRTQTVADDTGGDASRTRSTTYNKYDQVETSTDATQNTTSYGYDGYGNKTSQTDPQGNRTTYTYDPDGHLLTQVLNNYTGDPVNPQAATQLTELSRAYDPAGRLASITNAMGNTTAYTYTDNGLPVTATRTDSAGHNPFVMKTDTYDTAGNIVQEVTNNGATTTTTALDAASRPTLTREDPSGLNRTTRVSYTADDLVATSTRTDGSGATLVTSATYDPMGRTTSKSVAADGAGHPVGWWRLNQSGGSTVVDSSGTGNTATADSGVKWTGGGAGLNGTTAATVTTSGPVLTTTASYSVSAWVNLTAVPTAFQTAVSQDASVNSGFYLQYSPTEKAWAFGQPASDTSNSTAIRAAGTTAPAAATWYHLVGTYDSSSGAMSLYVNGAVAGTATNAASFAAAGPLAIGRGRYNGGATDFFNGQVANVQVYQRVLSAADVSTLYGAGAGRTGGTVASSRQLTTSWRLDQRGLPLSMTDANGGTTNYANDEAGRIAVTTSPAVSVESGGGTAVSARPVTMHGYNSFGDEVEQQDAKGNTVTTVYDANARPVSTTQPSYTPPGSSTPIVPVTVRTYNEVGHVTKVSDPLAHDTSYVYDQLGDVAQITDANGRVTHNTYNLNGEQLSTTDPSGAQVQATYDHLGRRITASTLERYPSAAVYTTNYSYTASTTNPGGAWLASQTSPGGVTTSNGYNKLGEQTSVTDGAGNTTNYRYDFLGRHAATVSPDNSSTTVSFDESGNPTSTSTLDPGGAVLASRSATYDAVGNVLSSTDARQTTTRFTYDALGRLTQEVQPDTASTAITTTFGYDAVGNKTRFTDGRHNSWVYTVNSWNLQESEIEPATATYSAAADRTFTMVYDAMGQPTRQVLPGGVAVTAGYDAVGQLKTQAGAGAEAATADRSFDYDPAGRVRSASTGVAGTAPATAETFTYNDRGLLLTATGSAGDSSFSYTADGRMGSRTDAAGATTYGYDTAGRLSTLNDPATATTMSYGYNTLNQVSSISYGTGGNQRTFGYDPTHRLKADTLKTGAGAVVASISYGYDANDNLTSKTTAGFAGAAANTYTYDLANRLTSWTAGSTTVPYAYDASGNRTQVGANVYTYDARDQLTSDGASTYHYTARGTVDSQTSTSGTVSSTSDAYGQTSTQSTQTYRYDALGRVLTAKPDSGTATQLTYSGAGNHVASDGTTTYTRGPSGAVIGIGTPGTSGGGVLAYTDVHNDVVGDFTATGTSLAGSTAYDPLGNVLATSNQAGHLGYQSGWTDPTTKRVNMAARWYNPATGQFASRDTVEQSAAPNSASFNPFAYAGDSPVTGTDPSGHGWWSTVKSWGSTAWHATVSAWHATTNFVSTYVVHPIVSAARSAWTWAQHTYQTAVNRLLDALDRQIKALQRQWQQMQAHIRAVNNEIKRRASQAAHVVATAYHATKHAVSTATTFVQHHAAAIGAFVVSTAVFMGCEAVLGAATGGVGAVAGAVACGALSGAVGGLFEQGAKCFDGQKGACSAGSFLKAGLVGGAVGGLAGLGGALGGKVLAAVGGKALRAIGGLFGRGGAEAAEGAAEGLAVDAASSTVDTAAESVAGGAARSGSRDAAGAGAPRGGEVPRGRGPSSERPTEQPRAGEEPSSPSCNTAVHSFTGSTPVLLATGRTKPIDKVKVGDKITNAVPGDSGTRTHTVQAVIVTETDHDFVDVTVAPGGRTADARQPGRLARAAMTTAAAVAAIAAAAAPAHGGTLTTTFHHPFYDRTQAAFVDAEALRVGDELQTPDGGTATVTGLRLYHATQTTYDLTVGGLHTYYVTAGTTPVLVHNCEPKVWEPGRPGVDNTPQGPLPRDAGLKPGADLKQGDYTYVVKKDGSLRAMHNDDMDALEATAGHTSLAEREGVHMAGTFHVEAGEITEFGNFSGHYRPIDESGFMPLEDIARAALARHGLPAPGPDAWNYYVGPPLP